MGRPKKENAGLTDLELMKLIKTGDSKALETLWVKYQKVLYKAKSNLAKTRGDFGMHGIELDDYVEEGYDTFIKAVNNVDLNRITKPTWTFWISFTNYLRSRNRDIINHYIKKCKHETSITGFSDGKEYLKVDVSSAPGTHTWSAEASCMYNLESEIYGKAIDAAFKKFDDTDKYVFNQKAIGVTKIAIANEIGIPYSAVTKSLKKMKNVVNEEIRRASEELKCEVRML